jgi:diguanylate cyclase (GGDEF)-like protein
MSFCKKHCISDHFAIHYNVLEGKRNKMDGNRSYVFRIFLLFFSIMLIVSLSLQLILYSITGKTLKEQLGNKCLGIAISVATFLEQDTETFKDYLRTLDTNSDYYIETKANLEKIGEGNAENIAFLYVEQKSSETEMEYVFDSAKEDSLNFAPPGLKEPITATREIVYESKVPHVGDFVTTVWGNLLSAYAPVIDQKTGELLAIVGADVSFQQYQRIMQNQKFIIIGNTLIFILLAVVFIFLSSSSIERRLFTDSLTGIYNRGFFNRFLRTQLKAIKKKNAPVMLFIADVDHFKKINDTYGHPFGDKVLANISSIMNSYMRKTDCLARYGGEEFAAILPDLSPEHASEVVKRIHEAVGNTITIDDYEGISVQVTISIGVVLLDKHTNIEQAIKHADIALYEAKKTRNTVVFYST